MTASPKVLSRLRKLLALAGSPEVHEAAAARAKFDVLAAKYGVAEADVSGPDGDEVVEVKLGSRGFSATWLFALATAAARAWSCEAVGYRRGARRSVRVAGRARDAGRAADLLRFLRGEVERLARVELRKAAPVLRREFPWDARGACSHYLQDFREGAVACLASRLRGAPGVVGPAPAREEGALAPVSGRARVREYLSSRGVAEARGPASSQGGVKESPYAYLLGDDGFVAGWRRALEVVVPEGMLPT